MKYLLPLLAVVAMLSMGSDAATVLKLNPNTNFAFGWGTAYTLGTCRFNTTFSSISLDPLTMTINTADFTGATTSVLWGSCSPADSFVPYGTLGVCDDAWTATTMVDLRGTGYKFADTWSIVGNNVGGSISFSNNNQTVTITGHGACGWAATLGALQYGAHVASAEGGWFLRVALLEPIVLTLNPNTNFAFGWGTAYTLGTCRFNTTFSSIKLSPLSMLINTADFSGATTSVIWGSCSPSASYVPYGTLGVCDDVWTATTMMDLQGTGYKFADTFAIVGNNVGGTISFSNNNQTVTITGHGACGWGASQYALGYDAHVASAEGGWFLRVAAL